MFDSTDTLKKIGERVDKTETSRFQREGVSLAGGYVMERYFAVVTTIEKCHYVHVFSMVEIIHSFYN